MKPTAILLVLALALGGLATFLLLDDPAAPPSDGGGLLPGSSTELVPTGGTDRGSASLDGEPVAATEAGADREEVVDKAALKAARDEARAAEARAKGPFLVGRIFDGQGFAVPDATVKLSAGGPAGVMLSLGPTGFLETTTTDRNGAYKVPRDGFFGDSVRVRVRADGFLAYDEELEVLPVDGDRQVPVVDLELGVVLAGLVQDAEGRPVEGAEVIRTTREYENRFSGPRMWGMGNDGASGKVVTDAQGRFVLGNEPEGDFVILVEHEAYPDGRLEGSAPYAGFKDSALVIELEPTARIAGRVEGFPRGRRFVDVHATPSEEAVDEELSGPEAIFRASGLTSEHKAEVLADGTFLLEGLEPGRAYQLVAKTQSGMLQLARCTDTVEAPAGAMDAVLNWDAGASVVFDLVDGTSGKGIAGSEIRYLWEKEDRGFMDFGAKRRDFSSSRIELTELRPSPSPGKLSMAISAPGYLDIFREDVEVEENQTVDLGKISLERAPVLTVRVLDAGDEEPLSRARLVLMPDSEDGEERSRWEDFGIESTAPKSSKGRTERDGLCRLSVSAARTATLKVTRTGYADQTIEGLVLPQRGEAETTVRLVEGGVLEVQVVDSNGDAVAKARVEHKAPSGAEGAGVTSRKGKIKLKDLEVGEYELRARRPDGGGATISFGGDVERADVPWERVSVASGAELPVTLRVPAQTNLTGTLTIDGRPLAKAEVDLHRGAAPDEYEEQSARMERRMRRWGGDESTKTDKNGRFELEELDVGPHHLRVTIEEGQPDHIVPVTLREGNNSVTADIRTGTLRGRVTDPGGKPIPGARVTVGLTDSGSSRTSWWGEPDEDGVLADDDGRFFVEHLPLDLELKARAEADGHVGDSSESFSLSAASLEAQVDITLATGASIRVTMLGEPRNFERLEAELRSADHADGENHVLDRRTRFVQGSEVVLRELEPGTWHLFLSRGWGDDENKTPEQIVEVTAGTEARVTIQRQ